MGAGLASATETKTKNGVDESTLRARTSRKLLTESEEDDEKSRSLHIED